MKRRGCLPWPRTRNCNISTDNSTPEGRFSSHLKYVYDVDDCSDDYDVQRHLVWLEPCLVPSMFDGSIQFMPEKDDHDEEDDKTHDEVDRKMMITMTTTVIIKNQCDHIQSKMSVTAFSRVRKSRCRSCEENQHHSVQHFHKEVGLSYQQPIQRVQELNTDILLLGDLCTALSPILAS